MRERIIEVYDNVDIYALYVEHELLTCNPVHHIIELEDDWEQRLNSFINLFEYGLLNDAGRVTAEIARLHAETEFEKYRIIQDQLFLSDYDRFLLEMKEIEKKNLENKKGRKQ